MRRWTRFGMLLAVTAMTGAGFATASPHHRHPLKRHGAAARPSRPYAAQPSTPDCRYPDGTPFDPDIIGGENHVGDGGPAVNLGGSDPCGY